jgi:hypothetical protein
MKTYLLLATCLVLVGCNQGEDRQNEIIKKLDSLKSDLVSAGTINTNPPPLRWASANKSDISTVIYQWTAAKAEEAKAAEKLSPDVKAKVAEYEALAGQLNQMRMRNPMLFMARPIRPGQTPEEPTAAQKDYDELTKKVEEAKLPIADVIDKRARESMKLNQKYSVESIVAEYAKGKYDLVVDSGYGGRGYLYSSSGDVVDITQSVINYFNDKQK